MISLSKVTNKSILVQCYELGEDCDFFASPICFKISLNSDITSSTDATPSLSSRCLISFASPSSPNRKGTTKVMPSRSVDSSLLSHLTKARQKRQSLAFFSFRLQLNPLFVLIFILIPHLSSLDIFVVSIPVRVRSTAHCRLVSGCIFICVFDISKL